VDERAEESPRVGWFRRLHLSWPMLFLAGWLLYEFTAQPALCALVACAKFGWADIRTALWLRRVDPDRWRGRTCFWAYLTYGLWKMAIMAILTMMVIGMLGAMMVQPAPQPRANNGFSPVLDGVLAAAMFGFGLSFPTAYVTLWSARRNSVRIWLGRAPYLARRDLYWPPSRGGFNGAPFVGFTCLFFTLWLLILAWGMGLVFVLQLNAASTLIFFFTSLSIILYALNGLFRSFRQVIAASPRECWEDDPGESVYQIPRVEEGTTAA
jgi:hypothetical protein